MKYRNVNNLIIEGPDGVGKTTLIHNIFKKYNYRYMCYHRGEISNFVFANKYNRPFTATQRGLPFIYIVLLCDTKELAQRIIYRESAKSEELQKVYDNKLFKKAAEQFKTDYDVFVLDTTNLTADEVAEAVFKYLDERETEGADAEISEWNQRYAISCKKYNLDFKVVNNQPYIQGKPIMVESTLHNGLYETFTDRRWPDNLLYSLSYDKSKIKLAKKKKYNFHYIINSKIKRRQEVFSYYSEFYINEMSCLVSDNPLTTDVYYINRNEQLFPRVGRVFGEDYISKISEADATVYCARDLEYLKLQTARLYEAILAHNIVFVDKLSDTNCDILRQIHGNNEELINLLYVDALSIAINYKKITPALRKKIIKNQNKYYAKITKELEEGQNTWKL